MNRLRALFSELAGTSDGAITYHAPAPLLSIREVFECFWPYARPYRGWLAVILLFAALRPALDAATIWLYKVLVDDVLVPRDLAAFGGIAAAYLALTLLGGLVSFGDDYLSAWVREHFLLALRTRVFQHLHGLPLDFFERHPLGDLVARLTSDIAAIEGLVLGDVAAALSYLLRIMFFTAALLYLQWDLALVSLLVAPLFWLAARYFTRRIKDAAREQRRCSGALTAVAEESLANVMLVQAYNRQHTEVARFEREGVGSLRAQLAATRLRALISPLVDLIELGGILVVVAVGTWGLVEGRLSLGSLLVFMAYLAQLYGPIRGLSRLANTVYAAAASAERVAELLDQQPAIAAAEAHSPSARATGALTFDRVSFRYPGATADALHEVSLTVRPGETVALVGASGAGKSTLAKLLLRFYEPTGGQIRLDGRTCGRGAWSPCARTWPSCCRRRSSLTTRSARTSRTDESARQAPRSRAPRAPATRIGSSRASRKATTLG
jgi:ATP-binding cassette, subfamily B, bacterial